MLIKFMFGASFFGDFPRKIWVPRQNTGEMSVKLTPADRVKSNLLIQHGMTPCWQFQDFLQL